MKNIKNNLLLIEPINLINEPYQIPGKRLTLDNDYNYHLISREIPDPNMHFKAGNSMEKDFEASYDKQSDIILQPFISCVRDKNNINSIITNIYVFENFYQRLEQNEFEIRQNYTIGIDGTPQIAYYVSFLRSDFIGAPRGKKYRVHKFSVRDVNIKYKPHESDKKESVTISQVHQVMACVINVNPRASRGTITNVKDVH